MSVIIDEPGKPWVRKHDYPSEAIIGHARAYPSSLADIFQVLKEAEEDNDPKVRACGSHWALSRAAITDRFQIETHDPDNDPRHDGGGLNKTLYEAIPECMSSDAWEFMRAQNVTPWSGSAPPSSWGVPPTADKFNLVCVEAGTRIWELYASLDAGLDPGRSIAKVLPNFNGPWAMPTLGGAGGQTIVGALSTGTHGGDVHIAPIADAVQAIHLVGSNRRQYWIERELGPGVWLIDEHKLRNLYGVHGELEVIRDNDALNAVMVAVGRMGVIYSVVLRVVRQFALREQREKSTWSKVRGWITNTLNPKFSNHFLQVLVNPNGQAGDMHQHSCFISWRNALPLNSTGTTPPKGRDERGLLGLTAGKSPGLLDSSYFLNLICADSAPVKLAVATIIDLLVISRDAAIIEAAIDALSLLSPLLLPTERLALLASIAALYLFVDWANTLLSALRAFESGLSDSLGEGIAQAGNWCAENDKFEYLRKINEKVFDDQLDPSVDVTAISYAIMDTTNYLDVACTPKGDSLEVFFETSSGDIVTFIDHMLTTVDAMENGWTNNGQKLAVGGWAALRLTNQTKALIGMQRWTSTCSIEIACPSGLNGTEPFLAELEKKALELKGTVHWGQRNNLSAWQVQDAYDPKPGGSLYRWRKTLARLSRNGRDITFRTPFSYDHGLEVVQPLVGDFTRKPQWAAAGAPVTYTWSAMDNPPGTEAWLEVHGQDAPPPIKLDGLEGTGTVPMPAGQAALVFRVDYTCYGELRSDKRVLELRGFADFDFWTFELPAVLCWPVDGSSRWAGELPFQSQYISDQLKVLALRCTITNLASTNVTKWYARTPGHPDIVFTPGFEHQVLTATRPLLNRRWFFFVHETGCLNPAPQLRVEFTLVASP